MTKRIVHVILIAGMLFLANISNAAAKCEPRVYFIGGAGDSITKTMKSLHQLVDPVWKLKGIKTEYHEHWQREDDREHLGKGALTGMGSGFLCVGILAFLFPPAAPACIALPLYGFGVVVVLSEMMGGLGKSLHNTLVDNGNPIILIGHSWGGDTAYEFAAKHLPKASQEYSYEPRISLVTLDAVGAAKNGYHHRNKLKNGNWLNIFVSKKQGISSCGGLTLPLGHFVGSKRYLKQRHAQPNIDASSYNDDIDVFRSGNIEFLDGSDVDHCGIRSMNMMYTMAIDFIEQEIRSECGEDRSKVHSHAAWRKVEEQREKEKDIRQNQIWFEEQKCFAGQKCIPR